MMKMKQKKRKKKKIVKQNSKCRLKKTEFIKTANSQYFFQKFHGLVLGLIGLIDVAQPIEP